MKSDNEFFNNLKRDISLWINSEVFAGIINGINNKDILKNIKSTLVSLYYDVDANIASKEDDFFSSYDPKGYLNSVIYESEKKNGRL